MKSAVTLCIALAFPLSTLACERPALPPIPTATTVSTDSVYDAIDELQNYLKAGTAYIDCAENDADTSSMLSEMNNFIDLHNQRMRAYRDRLRTGQQQAIDERS